MADEGLDLYCRTLKELFATGENSDAKITIGEMEIPVSRLIIRAGSHRVFASTLEHQEMSEKCRYELQITDCPADVFKAFAWYVYNGDSDVISAENVFRLYEVANKHEVHILKEECLEFMRNTMSVNNVCDVLTLAVRHSVLELRTVADSFFKEHGHRVIRTSPWLKFLKEYPEVANELIIETVSHLYDFKLA